MPYKNIVFAKLEKRLQNDPRWYMMSEPAQLNYVRFILFAAETYNKIPKDLTAIKKAFKTDQDLETIQKTINEIRANFPKFKQSKHFYYFGNFEEKTNYIPKQEILGKSRGLPKEATDKDKEEDKDKDKIPFPKFRKESILYLNKKTGKNFSINSQPTEKILRARYNEGRTLEEIKLAIDNRVWKWATDDKMVEYLRPSTLFRASNFENYLAEAKKSIIPKEPEIPKDDGLPKKKPRVNGEFLKQAREDVKNLQKKIEQRRHNEQKKT